MKQKHGMTFIEVLGTVAVSAVLAAIVFGLIERRQNNAMTLPLPAPIPASNRFTVQKIPNSEWSSPNLFIWHDNSNGVDYLVSEKGGIVRMGAEVSIRFPSALESK